MSETIFVTRPIFKETLKYLGEYAVVKGNDIDRSLSPEALRATARDAAGILAMVTDTIDSALLDACPKLRVVSNFAVGYNNIDVNAATARGVLVTNTPGVLTETTADFAWALLMSAARRVAEGDRFVRAGKFTEWSPQNLLGHDVFRKTLGLIGMGRIGQAVARRARGFDMEIIYSNPSPVSDQVASELGARRVDLEDLYRQADFISLHVPLLPETHHLLDDAAFSQMKPSSVIVNTSRGPVVDEQALARALERGTIAAAGLDVFEHEPEVEAALLDLNNVVLAPHIGSASYETRLRMGMLAAENLVCGLGGDRPPNLVNTDAWERRRQ